MWRHMFVVVGLLAAGTQAYAPIQMWNGPARGLVVLPKEFPGNIRGALRPQKLYVGNPTASDSPSMIPYFTAQLDQTITWDDMDWCLEAAGKKIGGSVRVNACTGTRAQKWNWIPDGHGGNMVQLATTNLCLDGSHGGQLELRECGNEATQWRFEEQIHVSTISPSDSFWYDARHAMVTLITLAGLGTVGVSAWLWHRESKKSHGIEPSRLGQEMVPAVMVMSAMQPIQLADTYTARARAMLKRAAAPKMQQEPTKTQAAELLLKSSEEQQQTDGERAEADGKIARSAAVLEAARDVAKQAVDALQAELAAASSDNAIAKVLANKGASELEGELAEELRKPEGTLGLIGTGTGALKEAPSLGGYDLNDPWYISEQFRIAHCSAVLVEMSGDDMLAEDALATTAAEQARAQGNFPGPLPIIARDLFVDEVQLAAAKAGGATGVILNMVLNGEDKTRSLYEDAIQFGLEPIVRVATEAELSYALEIGSKIICIGDTSLQLALDLLAKIPEDVVSMFDGEVRDVRGAWRVRDAGFHTLIIGKSLMEVCVRDRVPPEAIIKSMLSKGSLKFGLGVSKGRFEGAKENLGTIAM